MYVLGSFLILFSSIFIGFFGNFLGRKLSIYISLIFLILSFIVSIIIFYEVTLSGSIVIIDLYEFFKVGISKITIGLLFDDLTSCMLLVIFCISLFVHIFSIGYLESEPFLIRFLSFLGMFTFFMVILVTSSNFIQFFVGWEGVGLCSYLLINFWYGRLLANKAGLKAMIMNKISDLFLIVGFLIIFIIFGTTDFVVILSLVPFLNSNYITFFMCDINLIYLLSILLLVGAIGKSAQIGLHTWLPDAMEGPTPVSALLHAATMVTAGVYLLIRCSIFFEYSLDVLVIIALIGGLTSFICAFISIYQYDIKKIIAYSTCSQLGYMFLACGLSSYNLAFFHLFNHAFFKSLLFLGSGCIISLHFDDQDVRKMGCVNYYMTYIYICMLIGSIAIMGIPFLSGYYSKDLIIELSQVRYIIDGFFFYFLSTFSALLTSLYSVRLLIFVFFSFNNGKVINLNLEQNNNISVYMLIPIFFLSFLSLFVGFIFNDFFCGIGTTFLSMFVFIMPDNFNFLDIGLISPFFINLPLILSLLGIFIGLGIYNYILYGHNNIILYYMYIINCYYSKFFYNGIYINYIYNKMYLNIYKNSYIYNTKFIDKGFLELIGSYGLYLVFKDFNKLFFKYNPRLISISLSYIYIFILLLVNFYYINYIYIYMCVDLLVIFFIVFSLKMD